MNNLFISFELNDIEDNITTVEKAIESLGNSTKLHNSCWYVNSPENVDDAIKRISKFLKKEDTLIISDTSNDASTWFNLEENRARRIRQNWEM